MSPLGGRDGFKSHPFGEISSRNCVFGGVFLAKPMLKLGVVLAPRRTGHVPPRGAAAGILSPPSPYGSTPRSSCGTSRSSGSSLGGSAAPHPRSKAKFVLRGTSWGAQDRSPPSPKRLLHARRLVLLHEEAAGPVEAELAVGVGALIEVGPHCRRHRRTCSREKKIKG